MPALEWGEVAARQLALSGAEVERHHEGCSSACVIKCVTRASILRPPVPRGCRSVACGMGVYCSLP